ncbi:hypothetical protein [Microbispora hainanensis]
MAVALRAAVGRNLTAVGFHFGLWKWRSPSGAAVGRNDKWGGK